MIDQLFAQHFAAEWLAAWNNHDLERILSHYTDDFVMSSPVITKLTGNAYGTLIGKTAVGKYWAKALDMYPDLQFTLLATLIGVNSITLYYQGVSGQVAEVLHFNAAGQVVKAYAHYG